MTAANELNGHRTRRFALKKAARATGKTKQSSVGEAPARNEDLAEANKTASSVAHELNNLLTVIQINAEFLVASSTDQESLRELEEIQTAARRASILAQQLLASARLEHFDSAAATAAMKRKPKVTAAAAAGTAQKVPRVAETILLVDDEAGVRTLAKRILTQRGYRVLEASDGAIALRLAAGHVGEIDLVLTDIAMPNLGGRGLVEELQELSPGLRILFMSGYPRSEVFPDGRASRTPYLQKPFTSETLASEVRTALGYAD